MWIHGESSQSVPSFMADLGASTLDLTVPDSALSAALLLIVTSPKKSLTVN